MITDMLIKQLQIKANSSESNYYCYFKFKGIIYYADLRCTFDAGNECMIFKTDGSRPVKELYERNSFGITNDDVVDWTGIYRNNYVDITKESLIECISEFIKE